MTDNGRPSAGQRHGRRKTDTVAPAMRQFSYELAFYLPAPPPRVWSAFTLDIDQWWNYRLRDRARCLIQPEVGGQWIQAWDNGGALFGTFTVWDPPHLLVVAGPLAMMRPAHNVLEVQFGAVDGGTEVTIRHHSFGDFDADTGEIYEAGWQELIGVSLRDHLARR
jgi:uncharacterized protein YndB with AHSA1/START domain